MEGGETHLGKELVIVREYALDQLERNNIDELEGWQCRSAD